MKAQDLKNSILQLAIQGKLVEQREEEGTAKELIEKIQAEKEQLIKEKKIKKEKPLPEITEDEIPFDIPESWEWVRLGSIEEINLGFTYRPKYTSKGVRFLSVKDISKGKIDFSNTQFVSEETYENASYGSKPHKGDILFGRVGTIGKPQIIDSDDKFCIFVSLGFLRDHTDLLNKKYICSWMESQLFWKQVYTMVKGATVKNLNTSWLSDFLIPLPPLAEQKRIVAKIEELMPYVEQYDKAYTEVGELNKKFPEDMQKSILQYAIQGKLVEQREEDGTAEELYQKIQAEKEKLIKEGKIKKSKPLPEITEEEIPFDIPQSWKWVRIPEITYFQEGPGILAKDFRDSGTPLIRIAGMQGDKLSLEGCNYLDSSMVEKKWSHFKLDLGDIVISTSASMDKICETTEETVGAIPYTGQIRFKMYGGISKEYFKYFIMSNAYIKQINEQKSGGTIKHYGPTHLNKMLIPVPPLDEQKRIVKKIEELLPYTKQLVKNLG